MARLGETGNGNGTILVDSPDEGRLGRVFELCDLTQHDLVGTLARVNIELVQRRSNFALAVIHHLDDGDVLAAFAKRSDGNASYSGVRCESHVPAGKAHEVGAVLVHFKPSAKRIVAPIIAYVDSESRRAEDGFQFLCFGSEYSQILTENADRNRNQRGRTGLDRAYINSCACDSCRKSFLQRTNKLVGVLAAGELYEQLRVIGGRCFRCNREPEPRSAAADQ